MGGGWWLGKEISHSTEEKGLYQHRIMEPRLGQTLVERTEFNRSLMLIACDAKSLSLFPNLLSLRDQTVSDQPRHSQKRIWLSASFQCFFFFFLNLNFIFTRVPASRHIRCFLVLSSASVAGSGETIPWVKGEAVAD